MPVSVTGVPFDFSRDGVVDLTDFAAFVACMDEQGSGDWAPVKCRDYFDADDDELIGLFDFGCFQLRFHSGQVNR
ncbi:MAG: hypothetical protein ACYTFA_16690 [Planctomycetota bacterium]